MASNRAAAVSPTSPATHTYSGRKQDSIKPNPHPYAIRTSSTGLLTRSNSSGHNTAVSRHLYVPSSPSPRYESRRRQHKYSKSLNDELGAVIGSPTPLPIPSDFVSNATPHSTGSEIPVRRRAETLPHIPDTTTSADATILADDLPSNPKVWLPSQLSTYLSTALRISSPEPSEDPEEVILPAQLVTDIAKFVKDSKINGRMFLRLNDEDLDNLGINLKWRDALLAASRVLRQNVIKGRIWGGTDSPPSGSISPSLPSHPFSSSLYNSSSSSLDLSDDTPEKPRRRRGRVRGMVESFERSGSFSSESGLDDDGHGNVMKQWLEGEGVPEEAIILSTVESPVEEAPPPNPIKTDSGAEPSIEDLLEEADATRPWGARAWEELDAAPGVTVKRVVEPPPEYHCEPQSGDITIHSGTPRPNRRSANGSSFGRNGPERRVVTAVFAPSSSDVALSTDKASAVPSKAVQTSAETNAAADAFHDEMARDALEAQLAETRALVDAFRARLEDVERKVAELERRDALREAERVAQRQAEMIDVRQPRTPPPNPPEMSPPGPSATPGADAAAEEPSHAHAETHVNPSPSEDESRSLWAMGASLLPSFGPGDRSAPRRRDDPLGGHPPGFARNDVDPSSIADLPQYMFLVGLGVCAVVLRVVLKKAAGRTAGVGWRP